MIDRSSFGDMTAVVYRLRRRQRKDGPAGEEAARTRSFTTGERTRRMGCNGESSLAWLVWRDPTPMAAMKLFNSPWGRSIADYIAIVTGAVTGCHRCSLPLPLGAGRCQNCWDRSVAILMESWILPPRRCRLP